MENKDLISLLNDYFVQVNPKQSDLKNERNFDKDQLPFISDMTCVKLAKARKALIFLNCCSIKKRAFMLWYKIHKFKEIAKFLEPNKTASRRKLLRFSISWI